MESNLERRPSEGLKNLSDINSFKDFDLSKIDLVKGETPADINDRCLKLCQDYIGDDWTQQTGDTIEVKRISGGLTNQLYHCAINRPNDSSTTPQEVAISLYGPKYFDPCDNEGSDRLADVVIAIMMSKNNLGPQLYGVFEGGQIQKFYKHRHFKKPDHSNEKIVRIVFQYLARIHSMNVPLKKNTDWFHNLYYGRCEKVFERFPIAKEAEEYNCKTLMENDLRKEIDWCFEQIMKAKSPIVFIHNDYRWANIMITEPHDEVVICDFEYSTYGYRAYDFIHLMQDWDRGQSDNKSSGNLIPEDSVFGPLIQIYAEECEIIYGKQWSQNPINSVKHILNEVKMFLPVRLLSTALFVLLIDKNDPTFLPMTRKLCLELAENSFKTYFQIKEYLIKQKIV